MPNATYKCGRCGALADGIQPLRAPFLRMGSAMVEETVCGKCHAVHLEVMKEFWIADKAHPTHACRRCGAEFSGDEGKRVEAIVVQHEPKGDGSWTHATICLGCFSVFEDCCRKARRIGTQK